MIVKGGFLTWVTPITEDEVVRGTVLHEESKIKIKAQSRGFICLQGRKSKKCLHLPFQRLRTANDFEDFVGNGSLSRFGVGELELVS